MKVYILFNCPEGFVGDAQNIISIYSSEEKVEEYLLNNEYEYNKELDCWTHPEDYGLFYIQEYEVE